MSKKNVSRIFKTTVGNCERRLRQLDKTKDLLQEFIENSKGYALEREFDGPNHKWGYGGNNKFTYIIKRKGIENLRLKINHFYITTCDDFFDYAGPAYVTVRLKEYNKKSYKLFEKIKEFLDNLT